MSKPRKRSSLKGTDKKATNYTPSYQPQIERVSISKVKKNPKNARTHSRRQIRKLQASINKFGFMNPLLVGDDYVLLAGHGRLEAARLEGLTEVPVIRFNHLSAAQKRAYLIADNKISTESGWDREMLAIELGELNELLPTEGLDVSLTGFDPAEVDLILSDMGPSKPTPEDAVPDPPPNPATRRGDLWQLGKHRLSCGDAQDPSLFTRLMGGVSAGALFADPPYNVPVRSIGGRGSIKHAEFAFASGEMSPQQFKQFLATTFGNAIRVSAPGAVHYICMDWRHIHLLIEVASALYDQMLNLVVWNKSNGGQGSFYRSQHELIGVFRVAGAQHQNNIQLGRFGRNRSNVWNHPGINTFGRGRMEALEAHPTVKPVGLVADALLDCTSRGDVVLDQFAGSGTIFLAAEKVGRIAYGIEYEPGYVDVAVKRWQDLTKLDAILEGDGRTFDEICAAGSQERLAPKQAIQASLPPSRPRKAPAGPKTRARAVRRSKHG